MNSKRVIKLDQYEFGAVVNIINEKRNSLINQKANTEFINEILEKVIKAPTKKNHSLKREREKCER
jgi:hypothetical protein